MNVRSLGGAKYFLLFKDEFSHFRSQIMVLNLKMSTKKHFWMSWEFLILKQNGRIERDMRTIV